MSDVLTPRELDRCYRALATKLGGPRCVREGATALMIAATDRPVKALWKLVAMRAARAMQGRGPCQGCPKAR